MSNRNHLVPTPVVTKNGVQTTVHKKPRTHTAVTMPPVRMANAAKSREQLEHDTAAALVDAAMLRQYSPDNRNPASMRAEIQTKLPACSDGMLERLTAAAGADYGFEVLKMVTDHHYDASYMNDWLNLKPVVDELCLTALDPTLGAVAQKHYEGIAPQDDPERRTEQLAAIYRVDNHLNRFAGSEMSSYGTLFHPRVSYIKDDHLRALLTTYKDPGAVADLITDHELTDPAQIIAVMEILEQNPDHFDGIIAYFEHYGFSEDLDQDDFQRYLNNGALADGTL